MRTFLKILMIGSLGLSGLVGCIEKPTKREIQKLETRNYIYELNTVGSAMAVTNGDFDNDGDLDLVVGQSSDYSAKTRLYFFENDGEGNFTLKTYSKE